CASDRDWEHVVVRHRQTGSRRAVPDKGDWRDVCGYPGRNRFLLETRDIRYGERSAMRDGRSEFAVVVHAQCDCGCKDESGSFAKCEAGSVSIDGYWVDYWAGSLAL